MKYILVIAGSDPTGGAGIQADIKTITALGGHAATVIAAVTAQNSTGIRGIHFIPPSFIKEQVRAVIQDITPDAVKIGMLGNMATVVAVGELLTQYKMSPVILDPVMQASAGGKLLEKNGVEAVKKRLVPLVNVVTPNIPEAQVLAEMEIRNQQDMMDAAKRIARTGPSVVITGGHLGEVAADLVYDNGKFFWVEGPKLHSPHTHGTGCVFSSALATYMARGKSVFEATKMAHDFTRYAIIYGYALGNSPGAINPIGMKKFQDRKGK
ncbi:MAG: bifunctional hydroxymethylpyrimidine kinase/phosphomethylpyrimidine kinase [Deltaproteobacteria bacterium]|nr:MAG: bifunctional hydroxymethylpyrimidine kinase/phosphomethylpyrimidine kinase [Deltaproteobacteria bacterium]